MSFPCKRSWCSVTICVESWVHLRSHGDSTSLFVAFATAPSWNIYKTLFSCLLKTRVNGNNWVRRGASVLFRFVRFSSSQEGGSEAEVPAVPVCTSLGADQPQERISGQMRARDFWLTLSAEFWVQQDLGSLNLREGNSQFCESARNQHLEPQGHFPALLFVHALLLRYFTQCYNLEICMYVSW